ncbi:MAG TPA: hypothetical protein PK743_14555 [Luteimonas sp.]|nr:hypothetical protein [Luteimonas sp.]HRP73840.1 hypothetical protein [Luteimonas sp.]
MLIKSLLLVIPAKAEALHNSRRLVNLSSTDLAPGRPASLLFKGLMTLDPRLRGDDGTFSALPQAFS